MGGWGGVVQSHFIVKANLVLRLGWGFDNKGNLEKLNTGCKQHFFLDLFAQYLDIFCLIRRSWVIV